MRAIDYDRPMSIRGSVGDKQPSYCVVYKLYCTTFPKFSYEMRAFIEQDGVWYSVGESPVVEHYEGDV